jgi:hypothetical protein
MEKKKQKFLLFFIEIKVHNQTQTFLFVIISNLFYDEKVAQNISNYEIYFTLYIT